MMIPNEKYLQIARALLEKTKQHKAQWVSTPRQIKNIKQPQQAVRPGPERVSSMRPIDYVLQLPNSRLELRYVSPSFEPDRIVLEFRNANDLLVSWWEVEEGCPDWPLASELYEEVHRNVTGWDDVLEDVEAFLASDNKKTG